MLICNEPGKLINKSVCVYIGYSLRLTCAVYIIIIVIDFKTIYIPFRSGRGKKMTNLKFIIFFFFRLNKR